MLAMLLKTQFLRGLFALPLLGLMLIADALLGGHADLPAPAETAAPRLLDRADLVADPAPPCVDGTRGGTHGRWPISTPADLPLRLRGRESACPRI
jgi:hypothetical protein